MSSFFLRHRWAICLAILMLLGACKAYLKPLQDAETPRTIYRILPENRLIKGDAEAGLRYLTEGDYVGGGLPLSVYEKQLATYTDTVLKRDGYNANLPFHEIAFTAENGATVVSGSCFSCHASAFRGEVVLGLGNSFTDLTFYKRWQAGLVDFGIKRALGPEDSLEWEAYQLYGDYTRHMLPHIITEQLGVNTAFRLEEACAAHHDPIDLSYTKKAQFNISRFNIGSDVPPLWNVKKKQALYYNGMGRGDYTKLLMQASVLGIKDSSAARVVQQRFEDVLAWVYSLEPPAYPEAVDPQLVAEGLNIFTNTCEKCHGSYGQFPQYPNKIVPVWEVQTDPLYAQYFLKQSGLPDWYNASWFALSPPFSELKPSNGYIAPPLDGIWATAPFLHNGSVPTLEALLNSPERPDTWRKLSQAADSPYDLETVGWAYTRTPGKEKEELFDTTRPGMGNQGHYYGDELTTGARKALLEYLKTL